MQPRSPVVEGPVRLLRTRDGELSTRDLIECAALIDEGYGFGGLGPRFAADFHEMWTLNIADSRSGRPIHLASDLARRVLLPDEVLTLIDFALNPPICIFENDCDPMAWDEFYPPSRFVSAAKALKRHQLDIQSRVTADTVLDAARTLSYLTGLRVGVVAVPLSRAPSLTEVFAGDLANHYGVLLYAARRMHELRRDRPHVVAHFGWSTACGESPFALELLEDRLSGEYALAETFEAPFVSIDGSYEVTPPAKPISTPYIISVAALSAVEDLVSCRSPFRVDHLPVSLLSNPSFRSQVDEVLLNATGACFDWPAAGLA